MSIIKEMFQNEQPNPEEKLTLPQFRNQLLCMTLARLIGDHPNRPDIANDLHNEKPSSEEGAWHSEEDVEWIFGILNELYQNEEEEREFSLSERKRFFFIKYLLHRKEIEKYFDGNFNLAFNSQDRMFGGDDWNRRQFYQKLRHALLGSSRGFNSDTPEDYADYLNEEVTPLMTNWVRIQKEGR